MNTTNDLKSMIQNALEKEVRSITVVRCPVCSLWLLLHPDLPKLVKDDEGGYSLCIPKTDLNFLPEYQRIVCSNCNNSSYISTWERQEWIRVK